MKTLSLLETAWTGMGVKLSYPHPATPGFPRELMVYLWQGLEGEHFLSSSSQPEGWGSEIFTPGGGSGSSSWKVPELWVLLSPWACSSGEPGGRRAWEGPGVGGCNH